MRQQQCFAHGMLAAAIMLTGGTLAWAQTQANQVEVTIHAGGAVTQKEVGTSYTGAPIEQIQLSRRVSVGDLNLASASGKEQFRHRIRTVANETCNELRNLYPFALWRSTNADCVSGAVKDAMAQVPTIMAQARSTRQVR